MLPPVFGSQALHDARVVCALLLGLLLGNLYAGRRGDRIARSFTTFGFLQIGGGASAFVALLLLSRLEGPYSAVCGGFHGSTVSSLVGAVFVFAVLFVPAFLLGATLSLGWSLLGRYGDAPQAGDRFFSMLCIGASTGGAISGFALMPYIGARGALGSAALLISVMGFVAILSKHASNGLQPDEDQSPSGESEKPDGAVLRAGQSFHIIAYLVYIFSGVVCAVIWARLLSQVAGKTVYMAAAALVVYFAALALGSGISARLARSSREGPYWLGTTSAVTGIVWLIPFLYVNNLPFAFLRFFSLAPRLQSPEWHGVVFAYFALCFLVIFLPGLLMGSTFPLAVRVIDSRRSTSPRVLGLTTSVVILGALLAFLTSLAVPTSGLTTGRALMVIPWLAIVAGALHIVSSERRFWSRLMLAAALVVISLALNVTAPVWNKGIITSGIYIHPERYLDLKNLKAALSAAEVIFYEEDRDRAISVLRSPDALFLRVNGSTVASTSEDVTTQVLTAHIPMLLHRDPKRVLVAGLGTGITISSIEAYEGTQIDCVEPVPAIVKASRYFAFYNRGALQDARLSLLSCDPSNYLLLSREQYDVIICQQPMVPDEFVRNARARLRPGGIVSQVVSFDDLSEDGFKSIAKEFSYYFPHVGLWWGGGTQLLLVASLQPMKIQPEPLMRRIAAPGVRDDLLRLGITDDIGLLTCYMMGREALLAWAGEVRMNTRNTSPLLYRTPKELVGQDMVQSLLGLDSASEEPVSMIANLDEGTVEYDVAYDSLHRGMTARRGYFKSLVAARDHKFREAAIHLETAKSNCPENGIFGLRLSGFYISFSRALAEGGRFEEAITAARRAVEENPESYRAFYNLATLERTHDAAACVALLRKAIEINPDYVPAFLLEAEGELDLGNPDDASRTVAELLSLEPLNARAHHLRALCFIQRGLLEDARRDLEFVLKASPDNAEALAAIAFTWLLQNDLDKGQKYYEKTLRINPTHLEAMNNLAIVLAEKGEYQRAVRIWEKALQLNPGNPDIKKNITEARQKAGGS